MLVVVVVVNESVEANKSKLSKRETTQAKEQKSSCTRY